MSMQSYDKKLSPEAQRLLSELQERPEWQEILLKIQVSRLPPYKASRSQDKLNPISQFSDWVMASGSLRENERILKILSGERNDASRG